MCRLRRLRSAPAPPSHGVLCGSEAESAQAREATEACGQDPVLKLSEGAAQAALGPRNQSGSWPIQFGGYWCPAAGCLANFLGSCQSQTLGFCPFILTLRG